MSELPPRPADAVPLQSHGARCFGCGPDNPAGLAMEVFRVGDEVMTDICFDRFGTADDRDVVARFRAAVPGAVAGGS